MTHTDMQAASQPEILDHFGLSRDPEKAAQDMMARIARLIQVYDQETTALEASDVNQFLAVQGEKLHTARLYESGAGQILRRQPEMQDINPKIKEEMAQMQQKFSALAQRNLAALERMKRSTERASNLILNVAKREAQKASAVNYGIDGAMRGRKSGLSIGVNQSA